MNVTTGSAQESDGRMRSYNRVPSIFLLKRVSELVLKRRNGNVANRRKFTSKTTSRRVNDIVTDENIKAEILWKFVWRSDIRRRGG